jgi:small-conductance mechanosensitive channel
MRKVFIFLFLFLTNFCLLQSTSFVHSPPFRRNAISKPVLKSLPQVVASAETPVKESKFRSIMHPIATTQKYFETITKEFVVDRDLVAFSAKALSYGFWTFLTLMLLGTAGIDIKPLLSLISVLGLTLGFAVKDVIAHTFSGLFILFSRPFQRGDVITINGFKGKVMAIDLKYVKLISLDGKKEMMIPVSVIYGNPITIEKEESLESHKNTSHHSVVK